MILSCGKLKWLTVMCNYLSSDIAKITLICCSSRWGPPEVLLS